jgi:hypothetical protein
MELMFDPIAIHEAGHAYEAWRRGCLLFEVVRGISRKSPNSDGHCNYTCTANDPAKKMFTDAAVWLAGPAIEKFILGESGPVNGDVEPIIERLTVTERNPKLRKLRELAVTHGADPEVFMAEAWPVISRDPDPKAVEAIKKLAELLDRRGRVAGADAALCFEEVYGDDLPAGVSPAKWHRHATDCQGGHENRQALFAHAVEKIEGLEAEIRRHLADEAEEEDILCQFIILKLKLCQRLIELKGANGNEA